VLIAQGQDAADVPLTHTFGTHELKDFKVWIKDADNAAGGAVKNPKYVQERWEVRL
jgi:hypothetical protein